MVWVNRYRLVSRLEVVALGRNIAVELLLLAGLVVAVAILTDLRPGRDRTAAAAAVPAGPPPPLAPGMLVQGKESGDYAVALAYRPPGEEVIVLGQDGAGVNGLSVKRSEERRVGKECRS